MGPLCVFWIRQRDVSLHKIKKSRQTSQNKFGICASEYPHRIKFNILKAVVGIQTIHTSKALSPPFKVDRMEEKDKLIYACTYTYLKYFFYIFA